MNREFPSPDTWDTPDTASSGSLWRRLWNRLAGLFRRPRDEDSPMPEPEPLVMPDLLNVHEPSDDFEIETPAMGDAFNFKIRIRCSWCVQATATEAERERKIAEVREFIEKSRSVTRDRIEARVRPVARRFAPYRAAEAEEALNKEIADCLSGGDVQVRVRTWVDVSEPVREELQKVWRTRLQFEANGDLRRLEVGIDGDLRKLRVELLGELQAAWRDLLVRGLEGIGPMSDANISWLEPYALALAENPDKAPGYLKTVLEERVSHAEQLLTDLGMLAIDDRAEAIEFAFQSQSTLRALLVYLGVPVPSADGPVPAANAGGGAGA